MGLLGALVAAVALHGAAAAAEPQQCRDLQPPDRPVIGGAKRMITPEDLVELRDIGPVSNGDPTARILTISPDGGKVAFQIRRAEPDSNSYCLGIFVLALSGDHALTQVDLGGDYIKESFPALGFARHIPSGAAMVITPQWSPDGKWLAYLRRDGNLTQVWLAAADGSGSRPLTKTPFDVDSFEWADNNDIAYSGRPALTKVSNGLADEGRTGFLYDQRFLPASSNRPLPREPVPVDFWRVSTDGKSEAEIVSASSLSEAANLQIKKAPLVSERAGSQNQFGQTARVVSQDPGSVSAPSMVEVTSQSHQIQSCTSAPCRHVVSIWWDQDGRSLVILAEVGPRLGEMGLFKWVPASGRTQTLFVSQDAFIGCQQVANALICAHESFLEPRHLVRVDLATGAIQKIFDPNPEFASIDLGSVHRIAWTGSNGSPAYADLVLPPDHKAGQKHPMIVVQYVSRGFLRGGTGDEYPIQVFAAHGYAVLSFEAPMSLAYSRGSKTWEEINKSDLRDWSDRRNILSSLEEGVRLVTLSGVVDPTKVGLTGLSDGASTAQFAAINSRGFAAIAISTCCDEPVEVATLPGPAGEAWLHGMGYPKISENWSSFWQAQSFQMNAKRVNTPILMQVPDDEYLGALEGYTALEEQGKPVELYVFPDENHIKWQPIHRLAVYRRSLDWFDFWLRGIEDANPSKSQQYSRWRALKTSLLSNASTSPGP